MKPDPKLQAVSNAIRRIVICEVTRAAEKARHEADADLEQALQTYIESRIAQRAEEDEVRR